jgi:hypothetical protein
MSNGFHSENPSRGALRLADWGDDQLNVLVFMKMPGKSPPRHSRKLEFKPSGFRGCLVTFYCSAV